jgi:hypothetical protein
MAITPAGSRAVFKDWDTPAPPPPLAVRQGAFDYGHASRPAPASITPQAVQNIAQQQVPAASFAHEPQRVMRDLAAAQLQPEGFQIGQAGIEQGSRRRRFRFHAIELAFAVCLITSELCGVR